MSLTSEYAGEQEKKNRGDIEVSLEVEWNRKFSSQ
jgi:hypothetical protein